MTVATKQHRRKYHAWCGRVRLAIVEDIRPMPSVHALSTHNFQPEVRHFMQASCCRSFSTRDSTCAKSRTLDSVTGSKSVVRFARPCFQTVRPCIASFPIWSCFSVSAGKKLHSCTKLARLKAQQGRARCCFRARGPSCKIFAREACCLALSRTLAGP